MTPFTNNPFRPTPDLTFYQALHTHLRAAILSSEFEGGMKSSSTRAPANKQINISLKMTMRVSFVLPGVSEPQYKYLITQSKLSTLGCAARFFPVG
jgi:hypothetical protein